MPKKAHQSPEHRNNQLKVRLRLHFGDAIALGPGKADLLEAIAATGSIVAAAKQMNMSYRRAWLLVETMNGCFSSPLVETTKGGKGGGGARLSELGDCVLRQYHAMENHLENSVEMEELVALLAKHPPQDPH